MDKSRVSYSNLNRKRTNPINVRSFSSSKERLCWPVGICFMAKARHRNVSFPAKLTTNMGAQIMKTIIVNQAKKIEKNEV